MSTTPSSQPLLRSPYSFLAVMLTVLMCVGQVALAIHALRSHSAQAALYFLVSLPFTLGWCLVSATAMPAPVKMKLLRIFRLRADPVTMALLYAVFAAAVFLYGFK